MKTILRNGTMLLPGRKVAAGDVVIGEDGRIESVGASREEPDGAAAVDCSGKLVMPGFVNCHGHTAMTLVRGLGGGLPLKRWLEEAIFPVEAKMTPADVYAGARWGILEMFAGGTTTVADMYDFPGDGTGRALLEAGMRGRVSRVGLSFVEGRLDDCVTFTRDWNSGHAPSLVEADICIHSEYLTDEKFCRALADANRWLKRPLHVHVSETKREHEECIGRHGKTPIAYLADTGILDFGGYAAHCVHCTDDDFRIMAEHGVSLVHNPTSNMKLGSGFARIRRAMELGVNVALGTDGCASNDNLDMFEEMHLASLVHKGLASDPTVLQPWDVVEMATLNGAKALGMESETGSIEVGKSADLAIVDLSAPHLVPCLDVANLAVHSMQASDVVATYVAGRCVYEKSKPVSDDVRNGFLAAVARLGLIRS